MWLLRAKPVVHVDVKKNDPPEPNTTGDLVASYTLVGDPQAPTTCYVDEGRPFSYSENVTTAVKNDAGRHITDEKKRKRLVVKVWRDDTARAGHPLENGVVRGVLIFLLLEVLAIAVLTSVVFTTSPDPGSAANGAALAGVATSGALICGHIAMRVAKLAQPFEYEKRNSLLLGLTVVVPLLFNLLVLADISEWFFKFFSLNWEQLAETASVIIAILGLVGSIVGAMIKGAWDVFKWAHVEDAQRNSVVAREVMDAIERREEVHFRTP